MARAVGLSYTSVQRIWKAHGLKPHLVKTFKLSNDEHFVEKVRDIVISIRRRRWFSRSTRRNPGARPHTARLADQEGPSRHHDGLQAPRHDDIVRRARRRHRQGHRPLRSGTAIRNG